jgi:hypothetical protein
VDLPVQVPVGSDLFRAQVGFAHRAGYRAVQLNAAAAGVRPRELDRSARRDLAALLKRSELGFSGIDLWIPPEHFADASRVDRAVGAVQAAIELAADLDRLMVGAVTAGGAGDGRVVCVAFPEKRPESVASAIAARAMECGTRVADFGAGSVVEGLIGPGFDPAGELLRGSDGVFSGAGTVRLPPGLVQARLTDAGAFGRVVPGSAGGRLDMLAYAMSLTTANYRGHVVMDVRGLAEPLEGAEQARKAWDASGLPG